MLVESGIFTIHFNNRAAVIAAVQALQRAQLRPSSSEACVKFGFRGFFFTDKGVAYLLEEDSGREIPVAKANTVRRVDIDGKSVWPQ